ncbi:MAG: hypothetical protein EPN93_15080 [Spirochaetes bacterium]|nr:MAG: hypothetical protein EPN93_15080 [Spirochaetota bacterium]
MNKKLVVLICLAGLAAALSCGHWRVSSLKAKKLCSIKAGSEPGNIMVEQEESAILNVSFLVRAYHGRLYTADNLLKRVQVLDTDGTPLLVIGQKGKEGKEGKEAKEAKESKESADKVRSAHFNFGVVGHITADSNGAIYVQNRLQPGGQAKTEKSDDMDFSPSYVLVFDKDGGLNYVNGQKGNPDIPFYYIESIDIDKSDRLLVVARTMDSWSVYRFNNKKREYHATLANLDFKETEGGETYKGRIESVRVFRSGENYLVSVAYYSGTRFKYRRIFDYSLAKGKQQTVVQIPDPKNELFSLVDDKHMFLWNVEDRRLKFVIYNFDGNVINNIRIETQDGKLYEDVFTDETGQLYSIHATRKEIDVMEWK